jgi:3-methyladenine DNA glycosylase AlkD
LDVSTLPAVLQARLAEQGSPDRADGERRYLRSELTHLGVRMPVLRRVTHQLLLEHPLALPQRLALVEELWRRPVYELRRAAVHVLERSAEELDTAHLDLVQQLLGQARTWALVDPLAIAITGSVLTRQPAARSVMDRWIADDDFWIRRAALLAQLGPLRKQPDPETFDAFAAYADRVLDEREFFIRKAIGWVLREVGRRNPTLVVAWLEPRTHRASGVTMREAVKYLPPDDSERLMNAYRSS